MLTDWKHLQKYGYAPGGYMSKCSKCETVQFDMDKRATTCLRCATSMHEAEVRAEAQPQGCTRSHPHENMSAECEAKTVEARRVFWEAQERVAERIAQITAHRACCGTEHDPANGKLHGYCVVCGVPWPCDYAGSAPQQPAPCPAPLDESHYCPDCEAFQDCVDITDYIGEWNNNFKRVADERDVLHAKVAELSEELEEWRMTNKIDELYRELDANKIKVAEQRAEIERLTAEADVHLYWRLFDTSQATIAQQAERIAELETRLEENAMPDDYILMADKLSAQAALIEKCEKTLTAAVKWGDPMRDAPRSSRPEWFDKANSVLAAIAAHGGQS